jgi:hypothetical protein
MGLRTLGAVSQHAVLASLTSSKVVGPAAGAGEDGAILLVRNIVDSASDNGVSVGRSHCRNVCINFGSGLNARGGRVERLLDVALAICKQTRTTPGNSFNRHVSAAEGAQRTESALALTFPVTSTDRY